MTVDQVVRLIDYGDMIDVKVSPRIEYGLFGVTFLDMPTFFDYEKAMFHLQRLGRDVVCAGEGQAA